MNDPLNLKSGAAFSPLRLFLILLILGFGLRIAFGIARYRGELLRLTGPAFITSWSHDGLEHVLIAKAIVSGEGYIMENFPLPAGKHVRYAGQDALFKAPLYQYFLAGVFSISGFSFKLFFPLQALFGGLTCGFLGLIAWETFKSPGAALLAGVGGAIHPVLVNAASQPYNEDVFFFLFIAAIWAFLVWFRTREIKWAVACGVMVGLCTLTRESGIPLLAAMGAIGILSTSRDFKAWLACGTIALTAFAVVAPWTLRNYVRFHAFIPVAAIVGEDLATGNNDCVARESVFTSYWSEGPCVDLNRKIIAARAITPMLDLPAGVQYDRLSRRVAIHFITERPGAYAKLAIRRLWTSLLPFAPRGNQRGYERAVLTLYWLAIFPAGMTGMFLRLRQPEARTLFLTIIIALSFLSIMAVLYWSDLRFRIGIDLLLGCFAAWIYDRLWRRGEANSGALTATS
ncbi:MAG: glycosyltransferase family 39 protein [Candidatus Sulfotelmatobacter sp.]